MTDKDYVKKPMVLVKLGIDYQQIGEYDRAIECYQEALKMNPSLSVCWTNMGKAYREKGERQKAIDCFRKALEINPDNHQARFSWAKIYN